MTRALATILAAALLAPAAASAQDRMDAGAPGAASDAGAPAPRPAPDAIDAAAVDGAAPSSEVRDAGVADAGAPDAGAPDAGPPDAGPEQGAAAGEDEPSYVDRIYHLLFERAERAEEEARRAEDQLRGRQPVTVNTQSPEEVSVRVVGCDAQPGLLGLTLPERVISTGQLILLILLALLAIWILTRMRRPLPERGLVPRLLGTLHLFARIAVVLLALMIATRLLPGWLRPALLLTIAAAAIAIGFGTVWIVLPDVIAGILLVAEARVRRGLWITCDGLAGTVERVGPRVTVLQDADGHRLTVPNRHLIRSPIHAIDRRWPELQLSLRVPTDRPAGEVRRAVEDAVLCSPYLPPDPRLSVTRDPEDPQVWRIHVRLLEVNHREAFEGQLLERIEESIEASAEPLPEPPADD